MIKFIKNNWHIAVGLYLGWMLEPRQIESWLWLISTGALVVLLIFLTERKFD